MNLFEKNWITSRYVDFELKKYTFLGYMQKIERKFSESKVYPYLSVLKDVRNELSLLTTQLELLNARNEIVSKGEEFNTLLQVSNYAVPKLNDSIESGNEIEQFILKSVELRPVGVLPVLKNEGYLLFKSEDWTRVYRYQLRKVMPSIDNETHSTRLKTWFVQNSTSDRFNNAENIKYQLIKSYKDLPNPATYCLNSELLLPFTETLVPIGRKLLFKAIQD